MQIFAQETPTNRPQFVVPAWAILCNWFVACVLASCLSGCGGGDEDSSSIRPAPAQPAQPAVVAIPGQEKQDQPDGNTPATRPANPRQSTKIRPEDAANTMVAFIDEPTHRVLDDLEAEQFRNRSRALATLPKNAEDSRSFVILEKPPSNLGQKDPTLQLPENFSELPEAGYHSSGWPLRIRSDIDQSVMAFVPAGVFIQGTNNADESLGPEITMYLSDYYIDLQEVTVGQFLAYREKVSETDQRPPQPPANQGSGLNQPALGILWRDAMSYNKSVGKSLPTEAEWEKAARGAGRFDSPWGFGRPAWHQARRVGQITDGQLYPGDKSPYGVFDMAGNAREWCADWYAADAHEQAAAASAQAPRNWEGPRKAEPQSHRVIKGSSDSWNVWDRDHASLSDRLNDVGFRGVLRLPVSE